MSDYTITTDFGAKDSLPSGNAAKIIKGSEFTTEFTNIKTAVNTKADTTGDTFTGAVTFDAAVTNNAAVTINSTATITGDLTVDTNTLFVDVSEDKVGIGTTSPDRILDIESSLPAVRFTDTSVSGLYHEIISGNSNNLQIKADGGAVGPSSAISFDVDGSEKMRIEHTGNVGIGTTSPANTLTVGDLEASAIDQDGTVGIKCNANHKGIILQENSGAEQWSIGVGEAGSLKFYDSDSATPAVTFADISGNVGIGTDNPAQKLDVNGNIRVQGTFPKIEFVDTDNNPDFTLIGGNGSISFYDETNSATRMLINSSGNVGIGTTSPDSILEVVGADPILTIRDSETSAGATNATLRLAESAGGDTLGNYWDITHDNNAALTVTAGTSERLRIDSSGNLLVGTTSPTPYSFTTDSGICWGGGTNLPNSIARESTASCLILNKTGTQSGSSGIQDFRYDGTSVGNISISSTAVALNSTSDERLKENITDSADAGSKVDAIQIRQFDWKADGSHQDYGVIAQELVEVAPEAVHQPEDSEDMMGVDYSKLVPMLIKEVQSLRSRVAELENV